MQPLTIPIKSEARIQFLIRSAEDPLGLDGPNVVRNLSGSPRRISSVYVYDKKGTEFFELQCATPEYYLRRVESNLLARYSGEIVECSGPCPIVELGAGTAEKTRSLFAEYAHRRARCDYFPIDVDTATLSEAAHALTAAFPLVFVHCLGTTYERGLRALPPCSQNRLFVFLGSSIGNMERYEMTDLLSRLFDSGKQGDHLLLGADLDKDPSVIDKAYNDSAGFGARSTLNMLEHLNRRYAGNFVMNNFRYRSHYNSRAKRNEVQIESLVDQTVALSSLGFTMSLRAAELIDAEIMWKFDPDEFVETLDHAGFSMVRRWIHPTYRYGLFLLRHV